jgi:hypothetical protein
MKHSSCIEFYTVLIFEENGSLENTEYTKREVKCQRLTPVSGWVYLWLVLTHIANNGIRNILTSIQNTCNCTCCQKAIAKKLSSVFGQWVSFKIL